MKSIKRFSAAASVMLLLSACGGGDNDSSTAPAATTPAPVTVAPKLTTVSGTAATGAPFGGAAISITDKTGNVVGSGNTSVADGSFTITLKEGAVGPFVLQAVRDNQTLVSVAPDATSGTINITSITNLIAARLGVSGDPTKLAAEFQANPNLLTSLTIKAKVDEIVAILKPLLDALGATGSPLTTAFAANGTGSDRVLDSLLITITPASATTTNIDVSVRQTIADGALPPEPLLFSNTDTTIAALQPVTAANLVKPGTAPLIAALLVKMNACFALPVADRVNAPETGTATDIKAAACADIFYNSDPTTYKSNGGFVAYNSSFSNIFKANGDGLVFDRGTYEFTRINGDIVIGYRATDKSGNVTNDSFVVRPDNPAAPSKLQQIGNQYIYSGGITPFHDVRSFVNQPSSDYYASGYIPRVLNTLNTGGNSIFSKVVVTPPTGAQLTLKPKAGFSYLPLVKGTIVSNTNFVEMQRSYVSASKANLDPATADTGLYFSTPASTEAEMTNRAQQSVWKFDYYLAGNATATPDATQNYRTRSRALSVAELAQRAMPNLGAADVASIVAASSTNEYFNAPAAGLLLNWTVDSGALPPTTLQVFGFVSGGNSFNDSQTVGSNTRSGTVFCSKASAADLHCTGPINTPSTYVSGARLNVIQLFARDSVGREFEHIYATYKLTTPVQ